VAGKAGDPFFFSRSWLSAPVDISVVYQLVNLFLFTEFKKKH
jgi:hypothetical protein